MFVFIFAICVCFVSTQFFFMVRDMYNGNLKTEN